MEGEIWIFSRTEQISKVITEITVMLLYYSNCNYNCKALLG